MRSTARRFAMVAVLLIAPLMLAGCIVWPCWWCESCPPRTATFHVYVYDYYTYVPISWAVVELYEEDWWCWGYKGSWPVNPSGYAAVHGGYLYNHGGGGPDEETFRLIVGASGYCTESVELELDYWYPSETVFFYLVRWYGRGEDPLEDGKWEPVELPVEERPADRIMVGEPREGTPEARD